MSGSDWDSQQIVHNQNQEIKQDNLKTQIVSAITDLEGDRDLADFGRENKTIDLMSPPQAKSPTPKQQTPFTPTKQVEIFSFKIKLEINKKYQSN